MNGAEVARPQLGTRARVERLRLLDAEIRVRRDEDLSLTRRHGIESGRGNGLRPELLEHVRVHGHRTVARMARVSLVGRPLDGAAPVGERSCDGDGVRAKRAAARRRNDGRSRRDARNESRGVHGRNGRGRTRPRDSRVRYHLVVEVSHDGRELDGLRGVDGGVVRRDIDRRDDPELETEGQRQALALQHTREAGGHGLQVLCIENHADVGESHSAAGDPHFGAVVVGRDVGGLRGPVHGVRLAGACSPQWRSRGRSRADWSRGAPALGRCGSAVGGRGRTCPGTCATERSAGARRSACRRSPGRRRRSRPRARVALDLSPAVRSVNLVRSRRRGPSGSRGRGRVQGGGCSSSRRAHGGGDQA